MARETLTAAELIDLILDRLNELNAAIAAATDPADLQRLMSQRLDGYDMLTALTCRRKKSQPAGRKGGNEHDRRPHPQP